MHIGLPIEPCFDVSSFITEEKVDSQVHARLALVGKLHNDILALRCHRNEAFSSITRLLNEVLVEIFLFFVSAAYDSPYNRAKPLLYDYIFEWLHVTHVCHRWRAIALGQPRLWERIPIANHLDCVQAFVERSRGMPLLIEPGACGSDVEANARIFDRLTPATNRIKSMSLYLIRRLLYIETCDTASSRSWLGLLRDTPLPEEVDPMHVSGRVDPDPIH